MDELIRPPHVGAGYLLKLYFALCGLTSVPLAIPPGCSAVTMLRSTVMMVGKVYKVSAQSFFGRELETRRWRVCVFRF